MTPCLNPLRSCLITALVSLVFWLKLASCCFACPVMCEKLGSNSPLIAKEKLIVFPIGYLLPGICYNVNEGSDSYVCYLFCPRIISVSPLHLLHYDGINLHYRHNFGCFYCDSKSVKTILSENQVLLFPSGVEVVSCQAGPKAGFYFAALNRSKLSTHVINLLSGILIQYPTGPSPFRESPIQISLICSAAPAFPPNPRLLKNRLRLL